MDSPPLLPLVACWIQVDSHPTLPFFQQEVWSLSSIRGLLPEGGPATFRHLWDAMTLERRGPLSGYDLLVGVMRKQGAASFWLAGARTLGSRQSAPSRPIRACFLKPSPGAQLVVAT